MYMYAICMGLSASVQVSWVRAGLGKVYANFLPALWK